MTGFMKRNYWVGLIVWVAGCAQEANRPEDRPGSTEVVGKVPPATALATAEKVFQRHCYQIQSVDTVHNVVITVPFEYTARETVASISDLIRPSNHTFRKIATAHITPIGGDCASVSVRVDIQRRDTKAYQNQAAQRQGDDRPNNTTAFQSASADRERSEVWTPIRRDSEEEDRLLSEIKTSLQPAK